MSALLLVYPQDCCLRLHLGGQAIISWYEVKPAFWLAMAGYGWLYPQRFFSICMFVGKHTIFNWYSPCWSVLSWLVTCDIHMFSGSLRVCTVALCCFGQMIFWRCSLHMPDCWSCLGNKRSTFLGVSADILNVISSVPGSPHAVSLENSGHPANQGTMKPR